VEIKQILKIINDNKIIILVVAFIGVIVGTGYFFIPKKYVGTGSFYITRKVEGPSESFYKYDGYYSQQAALAYTTTVSALLESDDLRNKTLQKLNIPTTEENLRKYGNLIKIKKVGPQLVTLTVKDTDENKTELLWNTLANTLLEENQKINQQGDVNLNISKVSDKVVVKKEFDSLPLDIVVGTILFSAVAISYFIFKEYK
jgi:capsular polysaccharide biosynthesis protein